MTTENKNENDDPKELYRDDYLLIRESRGNRVGVFVGNPPEDSTPTTAPAADILDALRDYQHETSPDSELSKRQRAMIEHALVWLADSDDDHYTTEELHDTAEDIAGGGSR